MLGVLKRTWLQLLTLAASGTIAIPAAAQEIVPGDVTIQLEEVATGLAAPVYATHAGDGSGRLFIADQTGQIRIVEDGTLLETPFLDIADRLPELGEVFDERGLLGVAFHPEYAENGRFFVRYSAPREGTPEESCNDPEGFIVGCHKEVLAEFAVSKDDANVADPDSEVILIEVEKPEFNHNAGGIAFGPDGMLYFTLGDGGGANDGLDQEPPAHGKIGNGQNLLSLLGKVLRIDVDGAAPYEIPKDNPFVDADALPEIYAYGLRNPFHFSFDRGGEQQLILADVGQNLYEEINIIEAGGNYGWVIREGAHCFDPFNPGVPPEDCASKGLIDPVAEYTHADGIAVVGGYVYRGSSFPEFEGIYFFGDFATGFFSPSGRLFYIDTNTDLSAIHEVRIGEANDPLGQFVKSFGEDEAGEVYVCTSTELAPSGTTGKVYRITGEPSLPRMLRGDANGDGSVGLGDAIVSLTYQFLSGEADCHDAMDINDNGAIALGDVLLLLNFLFLGGSEPASPYPDCGLDETKDALDCAASKGCN